MAPLIHNSNPIVPWVGGKRRLADRLIRLMPPHTCYVEAFCGGAALYFRRPEPAEVEVLNDANGELINLYRVVQHHPEEFMRQFKWALSSRQVFKWLKDTRTETLTDIQRAARFFYLQQHAFGGKVAGQSFGTSTTSPPVNLMRIEERLSAAHLRLASGTIIEHLPWQECVKRYDRPHTFFYMDPPYWQTEGYGVPFEWPEYEALATTLATCQGKMMLSINDHPDIRSLFESTPGLYFHEARIKYSIGGPTRSGKESGELIITNYPAAE